MAAFPHVKLCTRALGEMLMNMFLIFGESRRPPLDSTHKILRVHAAPYPRTQHAVGGGLGVGGWVGGLVAVWFCCADPR